MKFYVLRRDQGDVNPRRFIMGAKRGNKRKRGSVYVADEDVGAALGFFFLLRLHQCGVINFWFCTPSIEIKARAELTVTQLKTVGILIFHTFELLFHAVLLPHGAKGGRLH